MTEEPRQLLHQFTLELEEARKSKTELELQNNDIESQIRQLRARQREILAERKQLTERTLVLTEKRKKQERAVALWEEETRIDQQVKELKKLAKEKLATAPWSSIAYDWQIEGAAQLATAKRGLLGDVRGMGKTLSSFAYRRLLDSKKTLVLTRKQYADEYIKELVYREPDTQFFPLIGADKATRNVFLPAIAAAEEALVVVNFEIWRRDLSIVNQLAEAGFDTLIIDEAHKTKSFGSITNQGYQKLAAAIPNVLAMTGTPILSKPQDLFSILHSLYPHAFTTEKEFLNDYCVRVETESMTGGTVYRWTWRAGSLERLVKKMSRFFVSRTPEDVGHKIPPPTIHHYLLDWEGYQDQKDAYDLVRDRMLAILESDKLANVNGILAQLTRLRQIASWPGGIRFEEVENVDGELVKTGEVFYMDCKESVKIDWAEDLINELLEEDQRVVLFSSFKAPVYELAKRLRAEGHPVATITGETDREENRKVVDDFDLRTAPETPKYKVLLATYDMIGESLNLNSARHGILLDRKWTPASDDQAIGRLDRLNSIDKATIHIPQIKDSIDSFMDELIEFKRDTLEGFKGSFNLQERLVDAVKKGEL